MRGTRGILMLTLSIVAGLAAVLLAARWLAVQQASGQTHIVVAARDLDLGQPLNGSMLSLVPWPSHSVPQEAFRDTKLLQGRVLRSQLVRGEPVLEPKLAPVGTKGGLSAVIAQGRRAITVKVNEVVGVAGFALPGNYVDVLVNTQDEQNRPVSKIVLERILVLAVAQEASRDDTKPRVVNAVTLEVTPEQAERIDLSRSVGTLSLVLRNQIDTDPTATGGTRKTDLLSKTAPEPARDAAPRPSTPRPRITPVALPSAPAPAEKVQVEVIRGVQRSQTDF
ncbi:MAG TPA: Flp pilus assembly protein CpaB [Burkholderiaceae bacterium]|nr:Flp pilus assembly protein CpaB [Burkholderiaceae bacterium]